MKFSIEDSRYGIVLCSEKDNDEKCELISLGLVGYLHWMDFKNSLFQISTQFSVEIIQLAKGSSITTAK